jgi:hypothetical protein
MNRTSCMTRRGRRDADDWNPFGHLAIVLASNAEAVSRTR